MNGNQIKHMFRLWIYALQCGWNGQQRHVPSLVVKGSCSGSGPAVPDMTTTATVILEKWSLARKGRVASVCFHKFQAVTCLVDRRWSLRVDRSSRKREVLGFVLYSVIHGKDV